jgi:hypothetical protein
MFVVMRRNTEPEPFSGTAGDYVSQHRQLNLERQFVYVQRRVSA